MVSNVNGMTFGPKRMRGIYRACCFATCLLAIGAGGSLAAASDSPAISSAAKPGALSLEGSWSTAPSQSAFGNFSVSGSLGHALVAAPQAGPPQSGSLTNFVTSISVSPEFAFAVGYRLNDAGQFIQSNYGELGSSSAGSLLLLPTGGADTSWLTNANYAGASWAITDNFRVSVSGATSASGAASPVPDMFALFGQTADGSDFFRNDGGDALTAGLSYDASPFAGIDLAATHVSQHSLSVGDTDLPRASDQSLSVSARLRFGGGWMTTATVGEGLTKLDVKPSALALSSAMDLHRTGYGLAVAKRGVFGDDALGLAVSRPVAPDSVGTAFALATSQSSVPSIGSIDHLFPDQKAETDFEVGYQTYFLGDSVALQTNAAYQMNFAGQNGTNAVSLLSRAKIKF
jgi:hypothetical protein